MANILPGWGQWLNGGYQSGPNDAFLAALRKYDPNAQFVASSSYGGEGGSGSDAQYTLQYDASKLPGGGPQGLDMNSDAFGDHGYQGQLFNPNDIRQDDSYGAYTPKENVNNTANDKNIVDIIGPLVVGAATLGGGLLGTAPGMLSAGLNTAGSGAFAAGGGAAGSGFSGAGSSMLSRVLQNAPRLLGSLFSNPTGPSAPQQSSGMSPQMLAILRLLQQRGQQTGGP